MLGLHRHDRLALTALIVSCAAVWLSSLPGRFTFDDEPGIVFRRAIWEAPLFEAITHDPRPVVALSLWLNYRFDKLLGGDGLSVWGYHLWNNATHLLAAVVLMALVRSTVLRGRAAAADERVRNRATWFAFACAVIWAVHPLQTQAVTYVIQRAESMMGLFLLLTVYCFDRLTQRQASAESQDQDASAPEKRGPHRYSAWGWSGGVLICTLLGVGCKQVMVVTPVLLVLYDRIFVAGSWGPMLRRRGVLHALVLLVVLPLVLLNLPVVGPALSHAWPRSAASASAPTSIRQSDEVSAGFGMARLTPVDYARSQPAVVLHYLRLAFWPVGQCIDYGWPTTRSWAAAAAPLSVIAVLLIATGVALWRWRAMGFCAAAFFVLLAPTSSFLPINDLAVEHRMYLPLAPLTVLVVTLTVTLTRRLGTEKARSSMRGLLLVGVAGALAAATVQRNRLYWNPVLLWRDATHKAPMNWRAHYALGILLGRRGDLQAAIPSFELAVRLQPEEIVHRDYALALEVAKRGSPEQVLHHLELALRAYPDDAFLLSLVGVRQARLGRMEQARATLTHWVWLEPNSSKAHAQLAHVLLRLDQSQLAVDAFEKATRLGERNPDLLNQFGVALGRLGRTREALEQFDAALQLDPTHARALANRERARAKLREGSSPTPSVSP